MATIKIFPLLILIFFIFNIFTIVSGQTEAETMMQECNEEYPLSEDEEASLRNMDDSATTNSKCFLACFLKKGGLMNEDGGINIERGHEMINEKLQNDEETLKMVMEIYEDCAAQQTNDDHCEIAAEFLICCGAKVKEGNIDISVT
ncbi:uncharacterized protein LOC119669906 [Teleopsis dalmanni]|uniref:uncharacterized protein LOC119669906 n=1 Tax=Teleopsis dalmanni TaxID=139649 RepID=UPI0018CF89B3|nr:uncharacterized protein LOC119669906 [Teleopsis dalmanni]